MSKKISIKKTLKTPNPKKKTTKPKGERKQPKDKEDTPLCDYVKMCIQKRKRVVDKPDSLGIGNILSKCRNHAEVDETKIDKD